MDLRSFCKLLGAIFLIALFGCEAGRESEETASLGGELLCLRQRYDTGQAG